jgi:peptidoglycan LD-endopeptidase CwlK
MQHHQLSQRSETRLIGVDPKLVAVVRLALKYSTVDFMVVEGVRSVEQCFINYGKGRTAAQCRAKGVPERYAQPKLAKVTWLNDPLASNHRPSKVDGLGKAVDLLPEPYDWKDPRHFDEVNKAMERAAKELGHDIRWGADWDEDGKPRERGESDSPHWELA